MTESKWIIHRPTCVLAIPGGTRAWVARDDCTGWPGDEAACDCTARAPEPDLRVLEWPREAR